MSVHREFRPSTDYYLEACALLEEHDLIVMLWHADKRQWGYELTDEAMVLLAATLGVESDGLGESEGSLLQIAAMEVLRGGYAAVPEALADAGLVARWRRALAA